MTIQQIKYFLELSSELHFWKTAEKVFISQSSLSRQIQSLENELGLKLFERDKRNVKLTDAGKFLQQHWTMTIKDLDQIQRQAKKIDEGVLGVVSISYPGSVAFNFLPNFLEIINTNLPDLKLELTEPNDDSHEKLLLDYQTDIAFSRDRIENENIDSLKLYSEPICIVVPENHWFDKASLNDLKVLQHEKFIISGLHKKTFFASLLRSLFVKYNFEPITSIESDFGGMILNLVSKGLGISILPYSFKFAKHKKVRFIELNEEIDLFISWRKNEQNKTIKKVVTFAKAIER
ncbi:LysR family transcriptional regulator [Cellulophaga sp. E16_2]|uniref:Transcriptional regulator, LysR family n=1 Tax=Cellulophaga algicola (strain DSM 14237 / IC166 / ACAM 630) TaxID=688270 RepID=E6X9T6_CELAD|nr:MULTISPECIES: LysR substrate-binding domain-containing protein [Cellulophaga]ADV49856.1 transcriptional regulator, LysR family [Cellulophaga algicola DSM 14237]MBO0592238.1 LysR family transcriptional regulator [Cellulophaga sp. E16_2]